LLEGLGFEPPSFLPLGLLSEEDFAVLTTDALANATPSHPGSAGVALCRRSAETPRALLHDINSVVATV
jgi:hypothetical protein